MTTIKFISKKGINYICLPCDVNCIEDTIHFSIPDEETILSDIRTILFETPDSGGSVITKP